MPLKDTTKANTWKRIWTNYIEDEKKDSCQEWDRRRNKKYYMDRQKKITLVSRILITEVSVSYIYKDDWGELHNCFFNA